jgi:membrane protease YdiL (CAAX protease family)
MRSVADTLRLVNPLAKILIYLGTIVLLAALLSPPLFWLVQGLGESGMSAGLDGHPFHRFFSRTAQVSAIVLLWPLIRWLNIRSISELGIEKNSRRVQDLVFGIVVAFLPVIILAGSYFWMDILRLRDSFAWSGFVRIFFTAAFVSVLEEILFRGVLLGLAVRSIGRIPGVLLVSAAFAVVHFLKPKGLIPADNVTWLSGFQLLSTSFDSGPSLPLLISGCIALFVIGCILSGATLATRSLWLAIGIHAGLVFAQQSLNLVARFRIKPPEALLPWVGPNVVSGMVPTGLVPLVVLLVTGLLVWWYLRRVEIRDAS